MKSANAIPFTVPGNGNDKVHALQHELYRAAKQAPQRRFHALYDKVWRADVLWRAWVIVARNGGAPGVDGVTIDTIAAGGVEAVQGFLGGLAEELKSKSYRPQPLRRVHIPKAGQPGKTRPLGIPVLADRVVMTAAKLVLEPVFEADFLPVSFGFRPRRSAIAAVDNLKADVARGQRWVLDADVSDCFGQIDHAALMTLVERRVCDQSILKLIRAWLRMGVLEHGAVAATVSGTPQGSPISPLLANIALHVLDEEWARSGRRIGSLTRYADDFVIVCATEQKAETARTVAQQVLGRIGLRLHPDKTGICDTTAGNEGFDFLGFHHHMIPMRRNPQRFWLARWPSDRAMNSIRQRLRAITDRRNVGLDLSVIVTRCNRSLVGWHTYFRWGNSTSKFGHIDSYAHRRLATWMSNKHGQRGRNWASTYHYAWCRSTGLTRIAGLPRPAPAHATR